MERLTISRCCRSHRSPISASITRTFISLRRSRHRHGLSCTPVIENFLKLGGCSPALSGCQVCRPAHMHTIEAGSIGDERNLTQLYWGSNFLVKNVVSAPLWRLGLLGTQSVMTCRIMSLFTPSRTNSPRSPTKGRYSIRSLMLYPVELRGQHFGDVRRKCANMVGPERFELPT